LLFGQSEVVLVLGGPGLAPGLGHEIRRVRLVGARRQWEALPGVFSLVHQEHLNHGALFGFLNNPNDEEQSRLANRVFMGVSAVAVALIIGWSVNAPLEKDRLLTVALGLILAGAMGNLYDRAVFGGVRDFLWFYYQPHFPVGWPVFNLADSWLVCGAGLLLFQALFQKPIPEASPPAPVTAHCPEGVPVPPGGMTFRLQSPVGFPYNSHCRDAGSIPRQVGSDSPKPHGSQRRFVPRRALVRGARRSSSKEQTTT